jgi:hypothetical protein
MNRRHLRIALVSALVVMFACTTVYLPQDDPLTEATLREAIETLRDSDGRVELLEDGIVVDLYVYEWRRHVSVGGDFGIDTQYERRLVGPKRDVYLPYTAILAVQARSWPLWSGVELELDSTIQTRRSSVFEAPLGRAGYDGPVIIKARDEQDAQKLSEAIDRVRRARLLASEPAESPAAADASEAVPVEGAEPDAPAP